MSELLPIVLNAKKGNWQSFMGRKPNPRFIALANRVLARDDHSCRYCGFRSEKYQEIVNADHNYRNNTFDNCVTACPLCASSFFVDSLGIDGKQGATIIYLPEINQADLNHFCRALFCSMLRDSPYKGKLQAVYLSLSDRARTVEEIFGPNTQEPTVFGQTLIDCELGEAQEKHPILSDLKLLPIRKFYTSQAEYWKSTAFANIPL